MLPRPITGTLLYDLVICPHRLTLDTFGDQSLRAEPNAFVQLLWDKGTTFEKEVMGNLDLPFLDLSPCHGDEKERRTREAIENGEPLIYSGRLSCEDLRGEPDLLRKAESGYIAGDIKSGSGEEGPEDHGKLKESYAMQLGLYTDVLERLGLSGGRQGFIWDIHGREVLYDFSRAIGKKTPQTWWERYQAILAHATEILTRSFETQPAYSSGDCKLCPWYKPCLINLQQQDDLTLLPELGRAKRGTLQSQFTTVHQFASASLHDLLEGRKTIFPGIGSGTLQKLHARAQLIKSGDQPKPYLRQPVKLPQTESEVFFDIEVDPLRDHTYLHGFIERTEGNNATEAFQAFFADAPTAEAERLAFQEAWTYLQAHRHSTIYYYSKYERTIYRKLQIKYPEVCSAEDIETLFDPEHAIDLYFDVVQKATEWPTRDYSIKTLAHHLGFLWRDTHPSGAASIEWFHRWVESGDLTIKQRILDYNEDDCRATRVLLDGIRQLPLQTSLS